MSEDNKEIRRTGLRIFDENPQLLRKLRGAEANNGCNLPVATKSTFDELDERIKARLAKARATLERTAAQVA